MTMDDDRTRTWIRSSHSAGEGACVEVRCRDRGLLAVRDSKVPAGPRLGFPVATWSAFVDGVHRPGPRLD
ncbi:DUF397 domain-containing protein [Streptomyces profundus]|nr:DUF397 domain-containing protein [Streptomyces sp. MA3_2.13]